LLTKKESDDFIQRIKGTRFVVINACYGGFSLSKKAESQYKAMANITDPDWWDRDIARDDPYLVKIVRELGEDADGDHAKLRIVEIPADVNWTVEEYDGNEWVAEVHRTWS
jgi:hypothetical protein